MGNTLTPETDAPRNRPSDYLKYSAEYGPYWDASPNARSRLQVASTGLASARESPHQTLCAVFAEAVKKNGDKVALRSEDMPMIRRGDSVPPLLPAQNWKQWTYQTYLEECRTIAKAMILYGLEPGDAVNIFGFNSPEWFTGMMGAIFAGGRVAGIYASDNLEQLQYKVNHSNGSIVFVETSENLGKLRTIADDLPYLKVVVCWACHPGQHIERSDGSVIVTTTYYEFMKKGARKTDDKLEERMLRQQPGDCCALIYTSGTTGQPKAVMISHDNLIYEVRAVLATIGRNGVGSGGEERILSYLPLSHVAGMMTDVIMPITLAAKYPNAWGLVTFARPYDLKIGTLGDRLRFTQPTIFLGVPRVWVKIQQKLQKVAAQSKGLRKRLAEGAKAKSALYQKEQQMGKSGHKPRSLVFYNVLLRKAKLKLGLDKCKFASAGAAPMSKHVLEYFSSIGININEVYGMSESTGVVTLSTDAHHVYGSVGYELPGCELKVFKVDPKNINRKIECPPTKDLFNSVEMEEGELCYRGRNAMLGYMANPRLGEAHVKQIEHLNRTTVDANGWVHSGDKGTRDVHGMVRVTGRYKELIIGSGGENVSPTRIESHLKRLIPAISNIMMVGNQRKYNVAIITLKAVGATGELPGGNELEDEALMVSGAKTIPEAMDDLKYVDHLVTGVKAANADGRIVPNRAAEIKKFTILPRDFSVETGELTATQKLRRDFVEKQYAEIIDAMYNTKTPTMYVHYRNAPNPSIPIGSKPRIPVASVMLTGFGLGSLIEETEAEVVLSLAESDY